MILGPTAGGKSQFAVELAEAIGGEVLSADSMQVYRHMDAGTAKPPPQLRSRVPHHFIDIVEPNQRFTVANWLKLAEQKIKQLQMLGVVPIVVGGTNLYLRALLEGLFDGPAADEAVRERLLNLSPSELHDQLARVDPNAAQRIHPNDRKRLVRALEVREITGRPITQWQQQWNHKARPDPDDEKAQPDWQSSSGQAPAHGSRHDPILIGLHWPVDAINRRINARVKLMFFPERGDRQEIIEPHESLPAEVRRLLTLGILGPQSQQALGYKQVIEHIEGKMALDQAFERTKVLTRRFAKNQRTWFKRFTPLHWLECAHRDPRELVRESMEIISA